MASRNSAYSGASLSPLISDGDGDEIGHSSAAVARRTSASPVFVHGHSHRHRRGHRHGQYLWAVGNFPTRMQAYRQGQGCIGLVGQRTEARISLEA